MQKETQMDNFNVMDRAIGFPNTYPMDSDLSGGQYYPVFEQPGPGPCGLKGG